MKNLKKSTLITMLIFLLSYTPILAQEAVSVNITFEWEKDVIESDLAGFKLYQSEISLEGPFEIITEINDPDARTITINYTQDEGWWYLTAYDEWGNESGASNTVDRNAPGEPKLTKVLVITTIEVQ